LVDIVQLLIYFAEEQITLLMAIVGGYVMESRKEKSGKEIKHLENVHVNDDVEYGRPSNNIHYLSARYVAQSHHGFFLLFSFPVGKQFFLLPP
jgi:hypothetical protein